MVDLLTLKIRDHLSVGKTPKAGKMFAKSMMTQQKFYTEKNLHGIGFEEGFTPESIRVLNELEHHKSCMKRHLDLCLADIDSIQLSKRAQLPA